MNCVLIEPAKYHLYYISHEQRNYVKDCNSIDECINWCKANCEEKGIFEYYFNGNKVYCEFGVGKEG